MRIEKTFKELIGDGYDLHDNLVKISKDETITEVIIHVDDWDIYNPDCGIKRKDSDFWDWNEVQSLVSYVYADVDYQKVLIKIS